MDISKHHTSVTRQVMSKDDCPKSKSRFSKSKNQLQLQSEKWSQNIGGINFKDQTTVCLGINCAVKDDKCGTDEKIDLGNVKPKLGRYQFEISMSCDDCSA